MAVEIMNRLIEHGYQLLSNGTEPNIFGDNIASEFMRLWSMYVKKHLRENPFLDKEVHGLDATKRKILGKNAYIAYGSTLISVFVYNDQVFSWQLGDGDVLSVAPDGEVEFLIPKDKRFIGNETTSTCSPNAVKEFKFNHLVMDHGNENWMFLLATDGYSNSFKTQRGFKQAGKDYYDMILEDGLEEVNQNLEAWLNETSQLGSGDDISVGIMYLTKSNA